MSIQICEEFGLSASNLSEIGTFINKGINETADVMAPLAEMGVIDAAVLLEKGHQKPTAVNTVEDFIVIYGSHLTPERADEISDEADPHAYVRDLASKLSAAEKVYMETFDAVFNSGVNAFGEVSSKEA